MNVVIVSQETIDSNIGKLNSNVTRFAIPYQFFYLNTTDSQLVIMDFVATDFSITGDVITMDDSLINPTIETK